MYFFVRYNFLYFHIIIKLDNNIIEFICKFREQKKLINKDKKDNSINPNINCKEKDLVFLPFSKIMPNGVQKKVTKKLKINI